MLSPDRVTDLAPLTHAAADYDIVRRAIAFISEHWRTQPEIDAIATAAGVTEAASAIASMVGCARQCSEINAMARRTES